VAESERTLVPRDVPVVAEFSALLVEVRNTLEPTPSWRAVDASFGDRYTGVDPVYVLALDAFEQLVVEVAADGAPCDVRPQIHAGEDRRLIGLPGPELARARKADGLVIEDSYEQAVSARSPVRRQPLVPALDCDRLDVEGDVCLAHVVVVDVGERSGICGLGDSNVDRWFGATSQEW
jgi:hypothetical protein